MARRFELVPADIAKKIPFGAGVILTSFSLESNSSVTAANILCATDGGVSLNITPEYTDMADGLDNCPSNTKELKAVKRYTVTLTGTAKTLDATMTTRLLGFCTSTAGTGNTAGVNTYKPQSGFISSDSFVDLWYVCDLGDGGFAAAKISNALNTGGFSFQSADDDKASFSFSFTGHYSATTPSVAPVEFYLAPPASSGG